MPNPNDPISVLPLAKPRNLKDCGKDEYWLQESVYDRDLRFKLPRAA